MLDQPTPSEQLWMGALVTRHRAGELDAFMAQGAGCGWCARPVRIKGHVVEDDGVTRRVAM